MDILISRENALSISLVPRKKNYEDYSALSLTAGNYSANLCDFNLLPEGLHGDRKLREWYDDFIAKVNTSKEIGVMNQFPPTLYFFVPHTKGDEQIDGLLMDLFNAIQANNAEEILLTHWMLISEKPSDIEFDDLIHFIKQNLTTNIKRIYLRIDEKFRSDFIQRFNQELTLNNVYMREQAHDSWAQYYDFVYQKTYGEFYDRFNQLTLQTIQKILPYKGSILDLGAGTGRLSIPLSQLGYQVTAVEKSTRMAAVLSENAELSNINLDLFVGDISEYNNGKADLALALFTVLSYACSSMDLQLIIENIKNHLNPNGLFFFDLPNTVFFERIDLLNKHELNFIRNVTLTPLGDNIYEYHEICSGIFHGSNFSYEDTFNIRHWKLEEVAEILSDHGFIDTGLTFEQFASTGSDYRLYKLQ